MTPQQIVNESIKYVKGLALRLKAGEFSSVEERDDLLAEISREKDFCHFVVENERHP